MKRPQNFVVEFKSGRRRNDTRSGSIWGNTDLKALVRAAEADAPHLFDPMTGHATEGLQIGVEAEPADAPSVKLNTHQTGPVVSFGNKPVEAITMVTADQNQRPVGSLDQDLDRGTQHEEEASEMKALKTQAPIPRSGGTKEAKMATVETDLGSSFKSVDGPGEELDTLEAENRRLKQTLAAELRRQNLQLLAMLRRFD
jgi:hypothetical protein